MITVNGDVLPSHIIRPRRSIRIHKGRDRSSLTCAESKSRPTRGISTTGHHTRSSQIEWRHTGRTLSNAQLNAQALLPNALSFSSKDKKSWICDVCLRAPTGATCARTPTNFPTEIGQVGEWNWIKIKKWTTTRLGESSVEKVQVEGLLISGYSGVYSWIELFWVDREGVSCSMVAREK